MAVFVLAVVWAAASRTPRRLARVGGTPVEVRTLNVDEPRRLPVASWTLRFQQRVEVADWAGLAEDLDGIQEHDPDLYRRYRLAYLHARALLGSGAAAEARPVLEPFLAPGDLFRDLALYYAAAAEEAQGHAAEAARFREALVFEYPQAPWRTRAIEDHVERLTEAGDPGPLAAFAEKLGSTVEAPVRRDLDSRVIALLAKKADTSALEKGLALLKASAADDAADRVALALDRPEWTAGLKAEDRALLGETLRNGRHFARAITLLENARPELPDERDELTFSIGRAYFGDEKYVEAERVYLEGAAASTDGEQRASFYYQASRCAQLLGDDARAERQLGEAVRHGGKSTRTSAALTQRIRLRAKQRRFPEAHADLRAVQRQFGTTHATVEAVLAFGVGAIGAGKTDLGLRELERVKPRLFEKKDVPEIQYWRARAVERSSPRLATQIHLKVLRADTPTHFAYFTRHRVAEGPLAARVRAENKAREAEAEKLLAAGQVEKARQLQTDAVLLAPPDQEAAARERLGRIYERIPAYKDVLTLPPPVYPMFPLFDDGSDPTRLELLLAMSLFDDATDLILTAYPLHPLASSVRRSEALRRAGASRASIYAIEVGAREDIPGDYVPQLLPEVIRTLIYPRYFYDTIEAEAGRHGADPRLVVSIMREESRFNPRAKSAAAARGLLQFIMTTARQVGQAVGLMEVEADDLYEPDTVIKLGARYIADLLREFGGNRYLAAAAYNAGPNQTKLWSRLSPGEGDDFFLTAVNFDETKDYVRKVMNSYERYGEIYEKAPPAGGVRPDP
jgi:hypothetical protein